MPRRSGQSGHPSQAPGLSLHAGPGAACIPLHILRSRRPIVSCRVGEAHASSSVRYLDGKSASQLAFVPSRAVLDDVSAGTLDDAGGDGEAGGEVLVIAEMVFQTQQIAGTASDAVRPDHGLDGDSQPRSLNCASISVPGCSEASRVRSLRSPACGRPGHLLCVPGKCSVWSESAERRSEPRF